MKSLSPSYSLLRLRIRCYVTPKTLLSPPQKQAEETTRLLCDRTQKLTLIKSPSTRTVAPSLGLRVLSQFPGSDPITSMSSSTRPLMDPVVSKSCCPRTDIRLQREAKDVDDRNNGTLSFCTRNENGHLIGDQGSESREWSLPNEVKAGSC